MDKFLITVADVILKDVVTGKVIVNNFNVRMNKDTHVYCLDCIHYKDMYNEYLNEDHEFSIICTHCYPWYPEDSRAFELRKNYVEKKQ